MFAERHAASCLGVAEVIYAREFGVPQILERSPAPQVRGSPERSEGRVGSPNEGGPQKFEGSPKIS